MAQSKLSMRQRIAAFITGIVPTQQLTRYSFRGELPPIAPALDVDYVQAILRSAESGNVMDLFALYRDVLMSDAHLQGEWNKRKLAVLGDPLNLEARDKKNADDVVAMNFINDQIAESEDWFRALSHLLDSSILPVALVEKVFKPSTKPGIRYELAALVPVPARLLDYTSGHMKLWATNPETGVPTGPLMEVDMNRYIVHRGHLLNQPDNWGGPMRSILFWWLLANMDRDWWSRYLDRSNAPFLVGKYDQGDDESRSILERAFSLAAKVGGLVISRETDVEIKSAASDDTAEGYEKFINICQREISKLIVGQAPQERSGMVLGDGGHKQQEGIRQDIRAFDGVMLGNTLRVQLFAQLLTINGFSGRAPKPLWGAESYENAKILGGVLSDLKNGGLEPTNDALVVIGDRLGFGIQRSPLPLPGAPMPLSADMVVIGSARDAFNRLDQANLDVARRGAAPLAQAFRGHMAPVRQILLSSNSPEDLEQRLRTLYQDWPDDRLRPLIQDALAAQALNAALR